MRYKIQYYRSLFVDALEVADAAFLAAAGRMLSVNNWHPYSGGGSAKFTLCYNQGDEVEVLAEEGVFISIDLPGLGRMPVEASPAFQIRKLPRCRRKSHR